MLGKKLIMDRIKLFGKHMLSQVKMKSWTQNGKEGEGGKREGLWERRAGPSCKDALSPVWTLWAAIQGGYTIHTLFHIRLHGRDDRAVDGAQPTQ